jgi:hypothetical protein
VFEECSVGTPFFVCFVYFVVSPSDFGLKPPSYKEKIALARITRTGNCSRLLQIVAFLLQKKEIIFTSCAQHKKARRRIASAD